MMRNFLIIICFMMLCPCACRNTGSQGVILPKPGKGEMEEMNRFLVQKDREIIENYIERKGLRMKESPTGLWYSIEKEGNGDFLQKTTE